MLTRCKKRPDASHAPTIVSHKQVWCSRRLNLAIEIPFSKSRYCFWKSSVMVSGLVLQSSALIVTSALFLVATIPTLYVPPTPLSIPRVRTTFASHGFSRCSYVWNSLPSGIYACSSYAVRTLRCLLKTHCFEQASVHPSGSHKCLRFGLWLTLCTTKDFSCLLTYLLTYLFTLKANKIEVKTVVNCFTAPLWPRPLWLRL